MFSVVRLAFHRGLVQVQAFGCSEAAWLGQMEVDGHQNDMRCVDSGE